MKYIVLLSLMLWLGSCSSNNVKLDGSDDPNLWLENVEGEKALTWVKSQNDKTLKEITGTKRYKNLEAQALNILQAKDKIPYIRIQGDYLYNFWQDDKHVKGLWRRTTLKSYKSKKPRWETVLDIDKLAKKEKENWVYKGSSCRKPVFDRCLIRLSRGGKDAVQIREFDLKTKKFVKNGFFVKENKSWVGWLDRNKIFVSTNFGEGTLTESGYPRQVRVWTRGTDLSKAVLVKEASVKQMSAFGGSYVSKDASIAVVSIWKTFFTNEPYLYENGKTYKFPIQDSAKIQEFFAGHFILELRKAWEVDGMKLKAGSLVAMKLAAVKAGKVTKSDIQVLYEQTDSSSILTTATTSSKILVNTLENVTGKIYAIEFKNGQFTSPTEIKYKDNTHITLSSTSNMKEDFFVAVSGFLNPDSLLYYNTAKKTFAKVKALPAKFKSDGMVVKQQWATSRDGTKIPYFLVGKKSVIEKGQAPTLLYGYGGFEVSLTPRYKALVGKLWMEKGGLYVMANIRGGGEFGPRWHQAALKTNRQKAYDDFIAVGEDLVKTGVTNKTKLAIQGGSNGGLLVGAVMTQRPDLFKAVLCWVPLLDMVRYSQLLAGASWVGEYGDPKDSSMRDYLLTYSPYHNVEKDKKYPELFLLTSTKDDRVHPGHARKMAAKMMSQGHSNIRYYENTEGGHAASANLKQRAKMRALSYEFLFKTIY